MSDVDIIISEMDDLKSKVDSRKVEICGMEKCSIRYFACVPFPTPGGPINKSLTAISLYN